MATKKYTIGGIDYIPIGDYAIEHGLDVRDVRRFARDNIATSNDFVKFGASWGIAIDAVLPEFTHTPRELVNGSRYVIHVTDTAQIETLRQMGINVIDPRIRAKIRRDAKKAVKNATK